MLYLLFEKKKEEKKKNYRKRRERWPRGFFPGQTSPIGCAMLGFSWLVGAIKSCFKGQSLNFMCN
jgi:hypothetical protein